MKKVFIQRICLLLLAVLLCLPADGAVRKRRVKTSIATTLPKEEGEGLLSITSPEEGKGGSPEIPSSRKMSTSAYPVKITVTGRAVQIQSDHNQLLPIYTRNGVLYLTTRLNKGTNWLGGLPQGHYFINNKPITIN